MPPNSHPGRLLKRDLKARKLSANRLRHGIRASTARSP